MFENLVSFLVWFRIRLNEPHVMDRKKNFLLLPIFWLLEQGKLHCML